MNSVTSIFLMIDNVLKTYIPVSNDDNKSQTCVDDYWSILNDNYHD